jgi:hypothetical protein
MKNRSILIAFSVFWPLRVAAARNRSVLFMPLRVAGVFWPLRVAAARNRSRPEGTRFPAPSCGQTLRPAPVMNGGGSPMPYGHASAAYDEGLLGHSALCQYLVPLFLCLGSLVLLHLGQDDQTPQQGVSTQI